MRKIVNELYLDSPILGTLRYEMEKVDTRTSKVEICKQIDLSDMKAIK